MSVMDQIAPERRKATPRVLHWTPPAPGQEIPLPVVEDDELQFPVDVVKRVREWLKSKTPEFIDAPPTPIFIGVASWKIYHTVGIGEGVNELRFHPQTIEVLLRAVKDRKILYGFHYLAARDQHNRCIVGPFLRMEVKAS